MKKKVIFAVTLAVTLVASASFATTGNSLSAGAGQVREIVGLKCPNHDYVKDGHNFMYNTPSGTSCELTRCIRCGYTRSLHKPQK